MTWTLMVNENPCPDECTGSATDASPVPGKPRARLLGDALIFATDGLANVTQRQSASLMCAVTDRPLTVQYEGRVVTGQVISVSPMLRKTLQCDSVPFVLIDLEPPHGRYTAFSKGPAVGVHVYDRADCPQLLALSEGFSAGRIVGNDVNRMVSLAVKEVASRWPAPAPLDERVRTMMVLLDEDPSCELEALGAALGLSAHHVSRLFARCLGLSVRRYALFSKIRAAATFMGTQSPLTDIAQAAGFVDSAHFAKVWTQCYGASPSCFFSPDVLSMDNEALPDWLMWHLSRRDASIPRPAASAQSPWIQRRKVAC
ncbi:AraC family transcriptional regulator [Hydrogenophaga sp. 5NK40-0174]|uniref:helix-turn-helix domain-containing protein n=1 Tax=Hydrogenophaga sp. 5NK40-0174 TaxID=3127649 RepID=UPI0031087242